MSLTQINSNGIAPGVVTADKISGSVALGGPKISGLDYPGDDTAALPAGGQTITVNGNGFQSGCTVFIDGSTVSVVSFLSETQLQFVAPSKATGLYTMYVVNPDGGTAILVPGMVYSGTPTWTTASGSLGTPYETASVSVNFAATGDGALSYAVTSGSSLPTGLSLSSAGALTGTVPATASDTTYTFNVDVIDAENQSTTRQFSVTYKTDVVTWSSPADGASFTWPVGQANSTSLIATSAAGKSVSFSVQSGSLPANVTVSGSTISGTPTTAQANTAVTIRATASDTGRIADRVLYFLINSPERYSNFNISDTTARISEANYQTESSVDYLYGTLRYNTNSGLAVFKYNLGTQSVVWAKDMTVSGLLNYYTANIVVANSKVFFQVGVNSPENNQIFVALSATNGSTLWKKLYDSEDYSVSGSTDTPTTYNKDIMYDPTSSTVWFATNGGNDSGWVILNESNGSLNSYAFYNTMSGGTNADIYGGFIVGDDVWTYHQPNAGNPCYVKASRPTILSNIGGSTIQNIYRLSHSGTALYTNYATLDSNNNFIVCPVKYSNGPIFNSGSRQEFCITTPTGTNPVWFAHTAINSGSSTGVAEIVENGGSYYVFGYDDYAPGATNGKTSAYIIKITNRAVDWAVRFNQNNNIPITYTVPGGAKVLNNKCWFTFYNNEFTYPTAGGLTGNVTAGGITYTIENLAVSTSTAAVTSSSVTLVGMYSDSGGKTFSDASNLSISDKSITITTGTFS